MLKRQTVLISNINPNNMILKRILIVAIVLLAGISNSNAQVNACSALAPALVFSGGVSCVTGTTVGATNDFSNGYYCTSNPNGSGVVNRDVWYKFTTPATLSGCWTFNLQRGTAQGDMMLRIYKNCSTSVGSALVCSSNEYADLTSNQFMSSDWTVSTTYYIQITARSTTANAGTFNLCVTQSSPQASNDACVAPMQITAIPQQTGNNTAGCNYTYDPAADMNVTPAQLCASTFENIAWYSFTAQTAGTVVINFENIQCNGAGNAFQLGVFQGNSCGSWTHLGCAAAAGGTVNLSINNVAAGQKFFMALDGNAGSNCHFRLSGSNVLPLPIKLLNFSAKYKSNYVNLEWSTATETNNDFFTVERSEDGINFEAIGTRKGAGNSNTTKLYELSDAKLFSGTRYYRLKQTDYDGMFTYSSVVAVKAKQKIEQILVAPNPVTGACSFSFDALGKGIAQISILNVSGQLKIKKHFLITQGKNDVVMFLDELDPGLYFISLNSEEISIKTQFIKQ